MNMIRFHSLSQALFLNILLLQSGRRINSTCWTLFLCVNPFIPWRKRTTVPDGTVYPAGMFHETICLWQGWLFHEEIPNLLKGKQKVKIILLVSYRSKCDCWPASILVLKLNQLFSIFPVHMLKEDNQIPQVILWFPQGVKAFIEMSKHMNTHK